MEQEVQIKPPVEVRYRRELEALEALDTGKKPINWKLSPMAVRTFILGSREPLVVDGEEIPVRKKYLGNDALVERCIITLAGNRGLMLRRPCCRSFCRQQSAEPAPIPSRERRGLRRT